MVERVNWLGVKIGRNGKSNYFCVQCGIYQRKIRKETKQRKANRRKINSCAVNICQGGTNGLNICIFTNVSNDSLATLPT